MKEQQIKHGGNSGAGIAFPNQNHLVGLNIGMMIQKSEDHPNDLGSVNVGVKIALEEKLADPSRQGCGIR